MIQDKILDLVASNEAQEIKRQRTSKQNSSLHVYCDKLAKVLREAGLDQRKVLKPSIEIPFTMESVKEQLWRPIQEAMFKKKSTTELTTKEINEVYEVLDKHLAEKFFVHVDFPSDQEQMIKDIFNN